MADNTSTPVKPFGYRWRSSKVLLITVISVAMFSDTFLFSFIVPVLPVVLEEQIHLDPSHTQVLTSAILSMNALVSIVLAPFTGHVADALSSKNGLMIIAWVVNVLGTGITASARTLIWLFIGRLIQTIAGSFIWIVGMAILGDAVGAKHLAKALGFVSLFVSAGLLCGPAVSGTLYQLVSYTMMWSSAFALLALGIILQCLVIEGSDSADDTSSSGQRTLFANNIASDEEQPDENNRLLPPGGVAPEVNGYQSLPELDESRVLSKGAQGTQATTHHVYMRLMRKSRVATALLADIVFAIVIASFETTIPIHIKQVFDWQTMQAGLLFLVLQLPSLFLVVPAGWLKDKVGMRYPVAVGFLLFAPSLWLLAVPGDKGFEWANRGNVGQEIYIITLLGIGVWRTLLLGFGAVEVMHGTNELAVECSGIFGPNGGYSRAFSLSNISWKLGMFIGPLLSGVLTDAVGYYYMNIIFAILCLITGIATLVVFPKR